MMKDLYSFKSLTLSQELSELNYVFAIVLLYHFRIAYNMRRDKNAFYF